jgi:hypothetical protein
MNHKEPPGKGLEVSVFASEAQTVGGRSVGRVLAAVYAPRLSVLLRNVSGRPLSVWEEWNSYGFYNLSLEILAVDGKPLAEPVVVRRDGAGWSMNGPSTSVLPPGEALVRDVPLRILPTNRSEPPNVWAYVGWPDRKNAISQTVRLRAVFHIPDDDSTRAQRVWTGTARSEPRDFLVV